MNTTQNEIGNLESGVAFSQAQLEAGFNAVCDKSDWKAPINAVVGESLVGLVYSAIMHFTATCPKVTRMENGNFSLTSIGYRRGPAGDH
jgi:hypothetical protein